jgi:acyl-CoA thioester hydrolase
LITPAKIQVRFSDIDVMGHVNNAIYLSYFEMARVHYFKEILGMNWDWETDGILLVRNEIDYISPIYLHDEPFIYISIDHIGTKSFTLTYEIKVSERIVTKGKSVMVSFNNVKNCTQAIPEKMKLRLNELNS